MLRQTSCGVYRSSVDKKKLKDNSPHTKIPNNETEGSEKVAKEPLEKQPQTHLFDFVKKIRPGCSMPYLSAAFASVDKCFSITNSLINK